MHSCFVICPCSSNLISVSPCVCRTGEPALCWHVTSRAGHDHKQQGALNRGAAALVRAGGLVASRASGTAHISFTLSAVRADCGLMQEATKSLVHGTATAQEHQRLRAAPLSRQKRLPSDYRIMIASIAAEANKASGRHSPTCRCFPA